MKIKLATQNQRDFSVSPHSPLVTRHSSLPHAFTLPKLRGRSGFILAQQRVRSAFTLLELLVVVGIIALLLVLLVPAFNSGKSANDITSAAYTIKGVVETARTFAKANNTYSWVGFYEEDGSNSSTNPPTPGVGRLVMSIVASKDGTTIYDSTSAPLDPTKLLQVDKLIKIDNSHLPLFAVGSGTGETFDTRPPLQFDPFGVGYNASRFGELNAAGPNTAPYSSSGGNTKYPFQYPVGNPIPTAQYTFKKTLQFSPQGECRINSTYDIRRVIEIGLIATRGNTLPTPVSGAGTSAVNYSGNVVALQLSGFGSTVKIFRR